MNLEKNNKIKKQMEMTKKEMMILDIKVALGLIRIDDYKGKLSDDKFNELSKMFKGVKQLSKEKFAEAELLLKNYTEAIELAEKNIGVNYTEYDVNSMFLDLVAKEEK